MQLATLPKFLLGSREAVSQVASSRGALLLGFLFVLSAGFAREYDGEDLFAEPWHLALPLVASTASCAILYFMLRIVVGRHAVTEPKISIYFLSFLALYWMTAPLAWVYAIPFERFLAPVDALRANLWLLALVSLWRVLLISQCASVLLGANYRASLAVVLLFGDTMAAIVVWLTPIPIFNIMGGVRLSPTEAVLQETVLIVRFFTVATWLFWFIGFCVLLASKKAGWKPLEIGQGEVGRVSRPLWALAAASLLIGVAVLPITQPALRLGRQVDQQLKAGKIASALAQMSMHDRDDFPSHWDPPPHPAFSGSLPPLVKVLAVMRTEPTADWVKELYHNKLANLMDQNHMAFFFWGSLSDEECNVYVQAALESPAVRKVVANYQAEIRQLVASDDQLTDEQRDQLKLLLNALPRDETSE